MDRHRHGPLWFIFMKCEQGKQALYEMHGVSLEYNLAGSATISCVRLLGLLMNFDLF